MSPSQTNKCTPSKSNKSTASPSKSNKSTASYQFDKTYTTQSDEKKVLNNIESPKDDAYAHMKSNFFTFLRETNPVGRYDLDERQYDPFVQQHKRQFIKKSF